MTGFNELSVSQVKLLLHLTSLLVDLLMQIVNHLCTTLPHKLYVKDISVLWHCWMGGRKGIWPVKNLSGGVLAWLFDWSEMQTCICPSWCHCHSLSLALVKSRLVFTFLVLAHPGSPGKRAIIRGVCVCVWYLHITQLHVSIFPQVLVHVFNGKVKQQCS